MSRALTPPLSLRALAIAGVAVCVTLTASVLRAQSTWSSVSGTVRDPSGAVLTDATITARNRATSLVRKTTSDSNGSFRLTTLPPGRYEITIHRNGFATHRSDLLLLLGEDFRLEQTLSIEAIGEVVDVGVKTAAIDPSATTLGRTITGREASELPVQGRLFLELTKLTPGILSSYNTAGNGSGFAAAGQTGRNNAQFIDGLALDDAQTSSPRGSLPLDAIRDFVVVSNAPIAEFGQASGAAVNVLTKSGTNTLNGLAFVYRQDGAWSARPGEVLLADPQRLKPDFGQTITGGSLGGPLSRNHAFFFGSMEYVGWNSEFIVTSPVARILAPNEPASMPQRSRQPQILGRVDWNLPRWSTLTFRYRLDRTKMKGRIGVNDMDFGTPSRGHDSLRHDDDVAMIGTLVFGPTVLNELRLQLAGRDIVFDPTGYCAGCPSIEYPSLLLGKNIGVPNRRHEARWQAVDAVTIQRSGWLGEHTFKSGVDVSFIDVDFDQLTNVDGTYRFKADLPFDPLDARTYPYQYTRTVGNSFVQTADTIAAAFLQDRWVPYSGVSLNLGVRWDYEHAIGVSRDTNNVAPRIGVAIDPWQTGKTAFRSSYGIYYDQVFLTIARTGLQALTAQSITINSPAYQGNPNPNLTKPSPVPNTTILSDLLTPYTEQASVGLQRALDSTTSLAIDAVWARGRHLLVTRDLNYPDLSHPHADGSPPSRPNPNFGKITTVESSANSWYRGLQIGLVKAPSRGFGYSVAYTLSSSERTTEDADFVPQDQRDYGADRGPSLNDARHRVAGTLTQDLPLRFRFAAVVTVRSALPYNIVLPGDENRDGNSNDRPAGTDRNSGRGTGFVESDLRLTKAFGPRVPRMELIVEVFNVANRRNWTYPPNLQAGFARRPTGAEIPRQWQVGLRASF